MTKKVGKSRKKREKSTIVTSEHFCDIRILRNEWDEEPPVTDYSWSFYIGGVETALSAKSYTTKQGATKAVKRFLTTLLDHEVEENIPINNVD